MNTFVPPAVRRALARCAGTPRAAALAVLVACAAPAVAQSAAPESGGLRAAVDSAWQHALESAEADSDALRAAASRAAARALLPASPALELSQRDERWAGERAPGAGRETELAAAWPLWLPGQKALRAAAADAQSSSAETAVAFGRWQVAGLVREAAWRVASGRDALRQAELQQQTLERLSSDVERRVRAGDLARADALAAQAEALGAATATADARLRLAEAERQWTLLTALQPPAGGRPAESPAASPPPLEAHPAWRHAESQREQARREQAAVLQDRRDPPELLLRYRQEAGAGDTRNSIGLGVRIPFGSDARNRPLEAQAAGAVRVAERRLARLRDRLAVELALATDAHEAARQRLRDDEQRAALARERAQLSQRAFDAGEFGLPELLRTLSAAAAAQADLERSQAALGLARARLLQAQGLMP